MGLALLALAGCSAADDRAEACAQAVEQHLDAPGLEGLSALDEREIGDGRYELTGHIDAQNGSGEDIRVQVTCTMRADGDDVSVVTDPAI